MIPNITKGSVILIMLVMALTITCYQIVAVSVQGSFVVGNLPPTLVTDIPNQTWDMGSSNTINLSQYFSDPNEDNLTYDATADDNPNINITFNGEIATMIADSRWNGTEYTVFTASDEDFNVSSNNVTLTASYANTAPSIQTASPTIASSPTITEEQNQTFAVSFTDGQQTNLTITWNLNGSIILVENKSLNAPAYLNSSSYTFTGNYSNAGNYSVSVSVSDGSLSATLPSWNLIVEDVNRAPYFNTTLDDLTWNQGSTYTMESLSNYATDPDLEFGDSISFERVYIETPSDVRVNVDQDTYEVNFEPYASFYGEENVYFKVVDIASATDDSNNVTITINQVETSTSSVNPSTSTGGKRVECDNYYYCGGWGKCNPLTQTRIRKCVDLADCRVELNPPSELEECSYIATCYDGFKNNGEEQVDCGGPCEACYTCYDGVQNQGEAGVDCGGPCDKECASCNDGVQNCHRIGEDTLSCEENVDCGGPCEACEFFAPMQIFKNAIPYILTIIIIGLFGTMAWKFKKFGLPKPKKKGVILPIESSKIRAITTVNQTLKVIDRKFKSMSEKDALVQVSNMVTRIINYKFNFDKHYTRKELVALLPKTKGDPIIKGILMNIFSKVYDMKYSGESSSKEELIHFIKQTQIINKLEGIEDGKIGKGKVTESHLTKLYKLYLKKCYYIYKGEEHNVAKVIKSITNKEQMLNEEQRASLKHTLPHKELMYVPEEMNIKIETKKSAKLNQEKAKMSHHHNVGAIVMMILVAGMFFFAAVPDTEFNFFKSSITGLVVYDNETDVVEEVVNETFEVVPDEVIEEINETVDEEIPVEEEVVEDPIVDEDVTEEVVEEPVFEGDIGIMGVSGPPVFITPTDGIVLTFAEDNASSYLIQGNSPDGDYPLEFGFKSEQTNEDHEDFVFIHKLNLLIVQYNDSASWINFTPTEEYVWDSNKIIENYTIQITIEDNSTQIGDSSDAINVVWNITNVNDAPNITGYVPSSFSPSVAENATLAFTYDNYSTDTDLTHEGFDTLTQTWLFNKSVNNTNVSWWYTPGFCDNGTINVTLNVTDIGGLSHNLTWEIMVTNTNRIPEVNQSFSSYTSVLWDEGSNVLNNITLDQYFNDSDEVNCEDANKDNLTYGYEQVSIDGTDNTTGVNVTVQANSSVNYILPGDWSGIMVIRFFANDSADITYSDYNVTLNVTNANDAPVLDNISDQNATSNVIFTYSVNATDADNDDLTYGDNSTLFNISTSNGAISFVPTTGQVGNYSILINVTDPSGEVDQTVFNLTIALGNRPPEIDSINPYQNTTTLATVLELGNASLFADSMTQVSVNENITLIFNQTSSDPDGNTLSCAWYLEDVLQENNTCSVTPYWTYVINFTQASTKNITLVVNDGTNASDPNDEFTWNLTIVNMDQPVLFGQKVLTSESDFSGATLNQTNNTLQSGNITLAEVSAGVYYTNGTYISDTVDLLAHKDRTNVTTLSWSASTPTDTTVAIRMRTAVTEVNLSSASWGDYTTTPGISITNGEGRYLQYEVNLTTTNTSKTPNVQDITFNYEIKGTELTGGYSDWIDLDNFFREDDSDDTVNYTVEYIANGDFLGLTIDDDNTIDMNPPANSDGIAIFRFLANDSYSSVYSNNISLEVSTVVTPTTITTSSGGGGGGGSSKTRIVPVVEQSYLQLIFIGTVELLPDKSVLANVILKNSGESDLNDIELSATSTEENLNFEFEDVTIGLLVAGEELETRLIIKKTNLISGAFSVDVIADVGEPSTQDIATINIEPLDNLTETVNSVQDMLQLNPICRELEEVVEQAQEEMLKKNYEESQRLLNEVIEGCKYLISAIETEQLAPERDIVVDSKGVLIGISIFVIVLLGSYFIPYTINKFKNPNLFKKNKKKR